MIHKHRLLAAILAGVLAVQLAACSTGSPGESSEEPSDSSSEASSIPDEEPPPEPVVDPTSDSEPEQGSEYETPAAQSESPAQEPVATANPGTSHEFPASSTSALSLSPYDVTVYVQDVGRYTVSDLNSQADKEAFAATINGVNAPGEESAQAQAQADIAFLLVRDDYTKFQYSLSDYRLNVDNSKTYALSTEDTARLTALADSDICSTYAQWLIYLRPSRVTGVSFTPGPEEPVASVVQTSAKWETIVQAVRHLKVRRDNTSTLHGITFNEFDMQVYLDFDSGVRYTLTFIRDELNVQSSDMSFGCSYILDGSADLNMLRSLLLGDSAPEDVPLDFANPSTEKPVIYLYPETATDVSVQLDFQGTLSYTYPAYNGGWNVTAQPDGTLRNKPDGSTHYYLFWDGTANRKDWDFTKGFVVAGSEVQTFFQEKLPALGLTPREYNDFITYWTPQLSRNPYNLITFSTTEYEETAPLTVTPAPDTVLRVHMVYKALSAPVEVEEQVLPATPERNGFTVVEWGGTRAS